MTGAEMDERPARGPMSGRSVIGEVTESIQRFLLDGWDISDRQPRIEENLEYVPKDREEVIYVYMYRVVQNTALQNRKRFRVAPILTGDPESGAPIYYHRPPLILDLFYLICAHSKFRSDAERLLGWTILRLHEATHLIYRPRRFDLPDGRSVDSLGRDYDASVTDGDDELFMEKVSLAMVDDLTVPDGINMFTIMEAPFRPFLTYRARVALDGPLYTGSGGTTIRMPHAVSTEPPRSGKGSLDESPSGRIRGSKPLVPPKSPPGPPGHGHRRISDSSESQE
jgi:hypothetical protein